MSNLKQILARLELAKQEDHWWSQLSQQERTAYLKQHPNSKYGRQGAARMRTPTAAPPVVTK